MDWYWNALCWGCPDEAERHAPLRRWFLDKQPAEQYALNGGGANLVFTQEYIDKNLHVIDAVIKAVNEFLG